MQKKLIVAPSPFLRDQSASTRRIMLDVIIAMLPTAIAAVWFFGAPALSVMITCVIGCVASELVYQKMTHQTSTIGDLSAVVTGLLLAFNMPASAPWWMGLVGSVIAIVLVKQMFGGIGQNFINPALAARTILMLSWTVLMAANVMPQAGQIFGLDLSVKAVTATPVAIVETVETTAEATGAATGETAVEATPAVVAETTAEATGAATGETAVEATPAVAAEATTEATGAATGEAAIEATPAVAAEATAEATGAATGETAVEAAPAVAAETTAEATGAATGEAAVEAAPAVAAEATTEATGAVTGETAVEATPAVAAEATAEATGAATGETAVEAAPAVATEATAEATGAATGETAVEAAPVVAAEATAEATGAATGETAVEATPAVAAEATAEATGAATSETAVEAAPAVAAETTAEATGAATGEAASVETTTEATAEATSSSTSAVEAVASATSTTTEATSVATPLSSSVTPGQYSLWDLFSGNIPGMLGETCKLTLLLGGLYLIFRRVIDWRIPVSFIGTAFILFWLQTGVIYSPESGSQNALYQLLSGGLILGAFFMATDYVTSPISKWGRVIMGIGCALVLYVIRFFNAGYPEGCSFAILFMNVLTPLIDRYTARKPFGYTKPPKAEEKGAVNA